MNDCGTGVCRQLGQQSQLAGHTGCIGKMDLAEKWQLALAASFVMGHNALLRCGELHSGLRVRDLRWDVRRSELSIAVARSKTHRQRPPLEVVVKIYHGLSAYGLLRHWLRVSGVSSTSDAFIFPSVTQFVCTRPMLRRWWNKMFRTHDEQAGFEASCYPGNSLRTGGATDLFAAGVSYPATKAES